MGHWEGICHKSTTVTGRINALREKVRDLSLYPVMIQEVGVLQPGKKVLASQWQISSL